MNTVALDQLPFESFAQMETTRFRVWVDEQNSLELQLVEATTPRVSSMPGAKAMTFESFALIFQGPADPVLPQRIYRFEAESVGQFELFIVPVSRDQSGTCYHAAFNRLVKA